MQTDPGSAFDLIVRRAVVQSGSEPIDIGIRDGRIAALAPRLDALAPERDAGGRLVIAGFVETHIHLDKACILGRCGHGHADLAAAIRAVAALKPSFTADDVYARGARVLDTAIAKGTTRMRTHVEVDPRAGLRSFEAIKALRRDYRWALDLSICAFPQEGLTNDPGTEDLLAEALAAGADALGGCPYTDSDPHGQIGRLFELAARFDVDLDFHLDFDLDPTWMHLDEIVRQTRRHGYGRRVAVGHVTKLSALPAGERDRIADQLAEAGVAVTVLPATDVYLMGRDASHSAPRGLTPAHRLAARGVVCSIASNNILNPFTPFGDASLLRMANFYAHVAHVDPSEIGACLDLVTTAPARLLRLTDYGLAVGHPADLVVLDAVTATEAVGEIAQPLLGLKAGRPTFEHARARLLPPGAQARVRAGTLRPGTLTNLN
ncbi:amidohydrolase family protein [Chelatococcus reniformis]|uniref:Amidohydrolase n=1 Tax=Chelatococcus reniformis TaxID=1494448 RepID=A0A916UNY3_9HYPH|nr:amidohydrolase family protein [Chelatococcus reniformis]GGC79504.1 amidohydrolase [Chelatococcus reniformis]